METPDTHSRHAREAAMHRRHVHDLPQLSPDTLWTAICRHCGTKITMTVEDLPTLCPSCKED